MTFSEEQIEWIVREVLRRLRVIALPVVEKQSATSAASELRIEERVVTLRAIEGRLNGVSRLLVPPRAVVTPAVKDELKKRKIELATSP